jgi:hypothetical protein
MCPCANQRRWFPRTPAESFLSAACRAPAYARTVEPSRPAVRCSLIPRIGRWPMGRDRKMFVYALAGTVLSAAASAQPRYPQEYDPALREFDQRYYRSIEPRERQVRGPVTSGAKYCSIYVPENWRDTFPVPNAWTWSDCRDFAASVGATRVHLMCLFTDGRKPAYSIGGPGDLPNPDCGWGARR